MTENDSHSQDFSLLLKELLRHHLISKAEILVFYPHGHFLKMEGGRGFVGLLQIYICDLSASK